MTPPAGGQDGYASQMDVLTLEEEEVLVALRGVVEAIRVSGQLPELESVRAALVALGAASLKPACEGCLETLSIRGVRFSMGKAREARRGIEICFSRLE